MRVIWAFDEETPPSVDASPLPYHDHRGVRSLYLKEPLQELEKTSDTQHWDIRAPGVSSLLLIWFLNPLNLKILRIKIIFHAFFFKTYDKGA